MGPSYIAMHAWFQEWHSFRAKIWNHLKNKNRPLVNTFWACVRGWLSCICIWVLLNQLARHSDTHTSEIGPLITFRQLHSLLLKKGIFAWQCEAYLHTYCSQLPRIDLSWIEAKSADWKKKTKKNQEHQCMKVGLVQKFPACDQHSASAGQCSAHQQSKRMWAWELTGAY